eukprot:1980376-Alexandrium_andersonii.AAC.1
MAGLIALTISGPVTVCNDSKSFLREHERVAIAIVHQTRPAISCVNDSDLWTLWYEALMQRGCASVRVVWSKAHTTKEQSEQIDQDPTDRHFNAVADAAATVAVERGRRAFCMMVDFAQTRAMQMKQVAMDVQRVQLEAVKASIEWDKSVRGIEPRSTEAGRRAVSVVCVYPPPCPTEGEAEGIRR